ncbi:MAG: hypothetical protein ACE5G9_12940 [Nitrospinales bacterium]
MDLGNKPIRKLRQTSKNKQGVKVNIRSSHPNTLLHYSVNKKYFYGADLGLHSSAEATNGESIVNRPKLAYENNKLDKSGRNLPGQKISQ